MSDIKDVFDKFEQDDFIAAKDELSAMLKKMTNDHIRNTLHLEADPIPMDVQGADGDNG